MQQGAASYTTYPGSDGEAGWNIRHQQDGTFMSNSPHLDFSNVLDYDLSPDSRHIAVLREDLDNPAQPFIIEIYNEEGVKVGLQTELVDLDVHDPSLKLFLLANGTIVLRDNIVGFTIYDISDLYVDRVSNASGSPEGETISRLVSSREGKQVYVYNPRIIQGDGFSSRISSLDMAGSIDYLYEAEGSEILNLTATESGEYVFAVLSDENDKREVLKINSTGEVVARHVPDMDSPGYYVQPELGTVTWFEQNNAQVYDIESNERVANAYFRQQNIVFAMYEPQDNVVLTVTGTRNNRDGVISANAVRIVDLDARTLIHSSDLNHRFTFDPDNEPRMYRTGTNAYQFLRVGNAVNIDIAR